MYKNKKIITAVLIAVTALIVMTYVERILQPGYWIKSLIKVTVFSGSTILYSIWNKERFFELIGLKKKNNIIIDII